MTENKTVFSNDAEVAVLSIILNNPNMAHDVNGLKDFMFNSGVHQRLFGIIQQMIEDQTPPEPSLIVAKLELTGELSKVGGKAYIQQLANYVYNVDTLLDYSNAIISAYKTRALISIGASVSTSEKVDVGRIDDEISKVRMQLDNLMEFRGGQQTTLLGDNLRDVYDEIVAGRLNAGIRGASWGIKSIDAATGGKVPGEVWVVGGRPGSGKTALIVNSILADAKAGVPSLLFEREMSLQQVSERILSLETGIPVSNIRLRLLKDSEVERLYQASLSLRHLPIFIDTSYRSSDVYYLESTVKKYKNLHGIQTVYVDYLQILADRGDNQIHELGRISRLFKSLSNELDMCSILVSQLNRAVELREDKHPILSDLRQSGNLEEDADIVVGLYRDEYYNKETRFKNMMDFTILKYRNGPVGNVPVKFENETNRISEL